MSDVTDAEMTAPDAADDSWVLAIDFGTSYTVAASRRAGRTAEVIEIDGERRMPSVMLLDESGEIKVGRAAETLASTSPGRVLRAPKSRLGDPAPVVLGGRPHAISDLVAALLRFVYDTAIRYHGSEPSEVRLTHPATWSGPRRQQLLTAAEAAGMPDATLVPEPVAAAIAYADDVTIPQGAHVVVYDLGGGTFDTAALQASPNGFVVMGRPGGDPQLGGELFDELLANAIGEQLEPDVYEQIQLADDLLWTQAAIGLRREARRVKEALSSNSYADVLLGLPDGLIQQRVERSDLHRVIKPYVAESVDVMQQTAAGAGLTADDLASIYLVGGASRSPLVEEMVAEAYPSVAISRRGDPKGVVAVGATHPLATPTSLAQRSSLDRASTLETPGPPPAAPLPPATAAAPEPSVAADADTVVDDAGETVADGPFATVVDTGDQTVVDNGTVIDGPGDAGFPPPATESSTHAKNSEPPNRARVAVGIGVAALLGLGLVGLATRGGPETAAPDTTIENSIAQGGNRGTIAVPTTQAISSPATTAASTVAPTTVAPTTVAPTTLAPDTTAVPEPSGIPTQVEVDAAMLRASDLSATGWVDLADDDPIIAEADAEGFCGPEPVVGLASSTTTAVQNANGIVRYIAHTIDVYSSAELAAESFGLAAAVYQNCDVDSVDLEGIAYDAFIFAEPFGDDAGLVCVDESIFIGTALTNGNEVLPTLTQFIVAVRCGSNVNIIGFVLAAGIEQAADIDFAQASTLTNLRVNNLPGSN